MRRTSRFTCPLALLFGFLVALGGAVCAEQTRAADLPFAAGSPLVGFTFDDKPLLLPPQQNFQMAMLTAGSELGRTCGKMEAYGWRMNQSEQGRVNTIFNATVDRLRGLGYTVAPQSSNAVSRDITIFAADRVDRHFLFMWSAGEIGLVMTLCETNAPLRSATTAAVPSVQTFPDAIVQSRLEAPSPAMRQASASKFTPLGVWMGGYTCGQGYTGGTLQITRLNGENFDGVFSFYPTAKNTTVPRGSYAVYGQYDAESKRILINPGKWIQRPPHYYNTVIVGGFDSVNNSFSAYFQGINGCTSFEAKYAGTAAAVPHAAVATKAIVKKKVIKKKKKAKPVAKPKADKAAVAPDAATAAPVAAVEPAKSQETAQPAAAPAVAQQAQTVAAPPATTPAVAAPTVAVPPTTQPATATPPAAPAATTVPAAPASAPASIILPATPPASPPTPPAATPTPAPAPTTTGQKSGAVETDRSKWIKVAMASGYENSGQWVKPQPQQAAQPTMVMAPPVTNPMPVAVNPALPAPSPNYVSPADVAPPPQMISGLTQPAQDPIQAVPPPAGDRVPTMADGPVYARDQAASVADPQRVPDYGYGYGRQ